MADDDKGTSDKDILKEARERLKDCIEDSEEEREKQQDDLNFSTLEQWPAAIRNSRENDPNGARPCLTIDKINQYISQVVNDFRQNPISGKIRPVSDDAHEDAADVFQGVVRNIEDHSTASVAYITAGDWAVRVGEGYFRFVTEYKDEKSFKQKIVIKPVTDAFSVFLGPHKMPDGSDAEYGFVLEDLKEEKFKRLYPKAKFQKTDFELDAPDWYDDDGIRVAEYFYFDFTPQTILFVNGQSMTQAEYDAIPEPRPEIQDTRITQIKTTKWCKLTGIEILDKRDWAGKWIPIVKVIGKEAWVEGKRHCWGLVRPAKDSLRMYNYWASALTEKIALSPKAPFIMAVGQDEGQEDAWKRANVDNSSRLLYHPVSVDGLSVPPPKRQEPTQIESGLMQMFPMIEHDVQTSLGMFKASTGESQPQQSGKAILALTRESDTGSYHFAGNMGISVCHGTRIMIDLIPKIMDIEDVMQTLGEDGQLDQVKIDPNQPQAVRSIPQPDGSVKKIYNLGIGEYGVRVTVGPSYNTRRMENAALFTDLANSAKDPGSASVLHYLAVKNADFSGGDDAAEMMKVMLPPPVQQVLDKSQAQIPPQARQRIAQLEQALQIAHQENQELKSGVAETKMKVDAHSQEAMGKLDATQKAHMEEMELEKAKALDAYNLEQQKLKDADQLAREKADLDAATAIQKAKIDAAAKIEVAEINAKCTVDQKLMEAEAEGNAELGETLGRETPIQKISSMNKSHMDMADKHGQMLEKMAQMMSEHMDMNRKAMEASSKPRKMTLTRDSNGRPTGGTLQ